MTNMKHITISFDAWDRRRNADGFGYDNVPHPMFDRGFTLHEHYDGFGLINMNGRCYDPIVSSFLSVDACLQDPSSAQGFNRYAYCAYNPLRYTDPTGWYMGPDDIALYVNLPEVTIVADDPNSDDNDTTQGTSGGHGYSPYSPYFPDTPSVPDGHSGTPASQNGPSFNPSINNGGNGNGGHGTGGNIGGGNKTRQTANAVGQLTNTIVSGTSVLYGCQATTIYKYPDLLTDIGKSMSKADKAKYIGQTTQAGELITAKSSARLFGEAAAKAVGKTGEVLGVIGVGIEIAQIGLTGEINAGNVYNGVIGVCGLIPGAGWVIGGVALVGDLVSYAFTGQTIGEHIDNACGNWKHKFWDGVY